MARSMSCVDSSVGSCVGSCVEGDEGFRRRLRVCGLALLVSGDDLLQAILREFNIVVDTTSQEGGG